MVFRPPLPIASSPHFHDDGKPTIQKQQWLTSVDAMFGSFNGSADGTLLANTSGAAGMPVPTTLTALLDHVIGTGRGSIIVRGATTWSSLLLGTATYLLSSNGTDLVYTAPTAQTRVLLNTITGSTIVDTTSLTSTYKSYELLFENLVPTNNAVTAELQIHSGGAFKNSGYLSSGWRTNSGSTSNVIATTTSVSLTNASSLASATTTTTGMSGVARISNPAANNVHPIFGQTTYSSQAALSEMVTFGGYWNTAGVIDGFQIVPSAGTWSSGTVYVYGLT